MNYTLRTFSSPYRDVMLSIEHFEYYDDLEDSLQLFKNRLLKTHKRIKNFKLFYTIHFHIDAIKIRFDETDSV